MESIIKTTERIDKTCMEVWHWPEFRAFATRLGIDLTRPTTALTIRLAIKKVVEIDHECHGVDAANTGCDQIIVIGKMNEVD